MDEEERNDLHNSFDDAMTLTPSSLNTNRCPIIWFMVPDTIPPRAVRGPLDLYAEQRCSQSPSPNRDIYDFSLRAGAKWSVYFSWIFLLTTVAGLSAAYKTEFLGNAAIEYIKRWYNLFSLLNIVTYTTCMHPTRERIEVVCQQLTYSEIIARLASTPDLPPYLAVTS